jgi:hypothetical protein
VILLHSTCVKVNETVSRVSGPVADDLTADTSIDPLAYSSTPQAVHPHPLLPDSQLIKDRSEFVLVKVRQQQRCPLTGSEHQTTRATAEMLLEFSNN